MSSPTFCHKHKVNHGKEGCPQCRVNVAERPYRGMNRTVWLDRDVVAVKPAREDAKVQAALCCDDDSPTWD